MEGKSWRGHGAATPRDTTIGDVVLSPYAAQTNKLTIDTLSGTTRYPLDNSNKMLYSLIPRAESRRGRKEELVVMVWVSLTQNDWQLLVTGLFALMVVGIMASMGD